MAWVRDIWRFTCNKINGVGDWFWSHWDRCTLRTMDTLIQAISVIGIVWFIASAFFYGIGLFIFPYTTFTVTAAFVFDAISIPLAFMSVVAMFSDAWFSKLRRQGVRDYWDSDKAHNFGNFLLHISWGMNIWWIIMMLFVISTGFMDAIYLPELHADVMAIKMIFSEIFLFPTVMIMLFCSMSSLFFSKLSLRILRSDIERLRRRESRDRGWCLEDSATEDDILDAKLERLGLS